MVTDILIAAALCLTIGYLTGHHTILNVIRKKGYKHKKGDYYFVSKNPQDTVKGA